MAILICPSCGGKISSTRSTCSHCGYEIAATKTCPECEESVDVNAQECPVCGYEFDSVPLDKSTEEEPVKGDEVAAPPAQGTQNDRLVYKFRKNATKEQFLRSVLVYLTEKKEVPADVLKASFSEVEEDQIQGFVVAGVANGNYSASVGYDRIEKYVVQKNQFVGANMPYTCNGHPKMGTGTKVMRDVEETRVVTDWQPYNGNITNERCQSVVTEPGYLVWSFAIDIFLKNRSNIDSLCDKCVETMEIPSDMYKQGQWALEAKAKNKVSFPGDHVKNERFSVSISDYSIVRCVFPIYRVYYEYEGKKYCAQGFAIDKTVPIVEFPKESQSAPTEAGLCVQKDIKVAKVKKPLDVWKAVCITLAVLSGILGFASLTALVVPMIVACFPVMVGCIAGAIYFSKTASKKVSLVKREYAEKINNLKHLKGLLLNKKITEFGLPEITEDEKIALGISDIDTEQEIDIDSIMTPEIATADDSTLVNDGEASSSNVTKNRMLDRVLSIIRVAFNIVSLITLIVGFAFLIFENEIPGVVKNGHGEFHSSYIEKALSGEIVSLLTVASTFVVFISLLIQLYLDISKTAKFKKALPITIIAMVFGVVAALFGYVSLAATVFGEFTLLFAILASASLLFVIARLVLEIVCKTRHNIYATKGKGKKALALILSSVLFCLVLGGAVVKESIQGNNIVRDYTFYNDTSLTSITIPEGVTEIGDCAFYGCTSLESVKIPSSVTRIGYNAFQDCTSLTSITIPEGVTEIEYYAFSGCTSLTSVTIPNSVTEIGDSAFYGCTSLESVVIPNSVTSIGSCAFSGCTNIVKATIPANAISNIPKGKLQEVVINGGEAIGYRAFDGCTSLTSITIPDSVTSIGDHAFYGCTSLTSITIPDSVTSIGDHAFYGCTSLTSITIPNSVTSIGDHAFHGCTGLESVEIPSSVTSIGDYAFYGCTSLTSITIPDSVTSIGDHAFSGCTNIVKATIPANAISEITKDKLQEVVINGGEAIGDSAFSGCASLESVEIPSSVISIGDYAFYNCTSLTSIIIPDSVTSIGDNAFHGCTSLESIEIPNSVTSIGDHAFYDCTSLTSVIIPDSVTSIGSAAFCGCTGLTIYCEADSQPSGWDSGWNFLNRPVVWGHTHAYENGICVCGKAEN